MIKRRFAHVCGVPPQEDFLIKDSTNISCRKRGLDPIRVYFFIHSLVEDDVVHSAQEILSWFSLSLFCTIHKSILLRHASVHSKEAFCSPGMGLKAT